MYTSLYCYTVCVYTYIHTYIGKSSVYTYALHNIYIYIYTIYIYIHTYMYTHVYIYHVTGVRETKTLLRRRRPLGKHVFGAPNQGLESSFCHRIAGRRLA